MINTNGTSDKGIFQINDITYKHTVEQLKAEGRQFDSWSRLNPEFNIAAGMYLIGHLKNKYDLEGHKLFTSYNQGVTGARAYASRSGSYQSRYSKEVESVKEKFKDYKNKCVDN